MTTTRKNSVDCGSALLSTLGLACADNPGVGVGNPPDGGSPDVCFSATITVTVGPCCATATARLPARHEHLGASSTTRSRQRHEHPTPTAVKTVTSRPRPPPRPASRSVCPHRTATNLVTIAYPAAWSCPADTSLPSSHPAGHVAHRPYTQRYDCASLANLRRPQLKAQSLAALTNTRANLISENCTKKTETRCLDSNGTGCQHLHWLLLVRSVTPSVLGVRRNDGSGGAMMVPTNSGAVGASGATELSTTKHPGGERGRSDYIKMTATPSSC